MADTLARFWSRVDRTGDCWLWQGAKDKDGYGRFAFGASEQKAHIFAYESEHGPVSEGKQLHHECETESCVRPSHLKPLSGKEHMADYTPASSAYRNKRKTHCPKGHEYSPENTFVKKGCRHCKKCNNATAKSYHWSHREAILARKARSREAARGT